MAVLNRRIKATEEEQCLAHKNSGLTLSVVEDLRTEAVDTKIKSSLAFLYQIHWLSGVSD
jgi:hypothetical protein